LSRKDKKYEVEISREGEVKEVKDAADAGNEEIREQISNINVCPYLASLTSPSPTPIPYSHP